MIEEKQLNISRMVFSWKFILKKSGCLCVFNGRKFIKDKLFLSWKETISVSWLFTEYIIGRRGKSNND